MNWLMISKFTCRIEMTWTFTAYIQLHIFMMTHMRFKVTTAAEFLLTNVTCEPSAFIVWLQQMCLELAKPCKTFWTVSTWVWLYISVSTNMLLQMMATLERLPTVTAVIRSMLLCTLCLCSCKLLDWLKLLSHSEHLYGLSPVWTLMCLFRLPNSINILSHSWHLYGFSALWTLLWTTRWLDCVNCLL